MEKGNGLTKTADTLESFAVGDGSAEDGKTSHIGD